MTVKTALFHRRDGQRLEWAQSSRLGRPRNYP